MRVCTPWCSLWRSSVLPRTGFISSSFSGSWHGESSRRYRFACGRRARHREGRRAALRRCLPQRCWTLLGPLAVDCLGGVRPQRQGHRVHAATVFGGGAAYLCRCRQRRAVAQPRRDHVSRIDRLCDRSHWRRDARRHDGAQQGRALVLRSDHIGRISDAEDRIPADHHPLARALRRFQNLRCRLRCHFPRSDRDACRIGRRGKGIDLVRTKYGRERTRIDVASRASGGTAANSHRPASLAADRADRRDHRRNGDGRLRAWRRHDERLAVCRFTRRFRRYRRDRHRRLCADQGHGARPPPALDLAPGERRTALVHFAVIAWRVDGQPCLIPLFPPTIGSAIAFDAPRTNASRRTTMRGKTISFAIALLACSVGAGGLKAQAEPLKIRGAWVAPLANLASVWLQKKDLAVHFGQSYTFEPVHFAGTPPMITAIANNEIEIGNLAFSTLPIAIENAGMDR